jgi:tRNA/tmRNA/rRNA uracil-C5-methylase (TrmA/RlmC/RlmD family)
VEDAKENARINNITNAEFIVGKAEDVIATRLKSLKQECVAIIGML